MPRRAVAFQWLALLASGCSPSQAENRSPYCTVPLTPDAGPATLDDLPLATWCQTVDFARGAADPVSEWTYDSGLVVVGYAAGGDCDQQYVFDGLSHALVASVSGCNGHERCVAGDPSFVCPTDPNANRINNFTTDRDCVSQVAGTTVSNNVCGDAGFGPLPDGAGGGCTQDSDCPTGYTCTFSASSGCSPGGGGVCLGPADIRVRFPGCLPVTACACDGSPAQGCVNPQGVGYFAKPVPGAGQPSTCPDGM
jgi:hypothetical protein